ncbi:hypothetical protein T09_15256 [Trichinella sp. T9]|uniref:Uncharacterized protein n=1 Tax=Trichinella murrelli TaxID=144512 RepID=A0A0V0UBF2_9BILA|nr:hypothetical protein T05_2538 [Trichinella murrelli]KRX64526.1 hypothetical protein T09_15256 [Trichinella sp. T9]KRZ88839.1 hypothetical protein T08_9581 [Trichinella sp. T8]
MRKYPNRKHHRVFGIICISCLSFCFSLKLHNDVDVKEQVIICILKCAYFCLLCLLDLVGQQMVLRTEEQIRREVLHAEGRTACMHASMYDCVLNNNSSLVAILANFHHCFRQTETTPEKSKQASFGDK